MKIYICCHKKAPVPISDILTPIHVGRAIAENDLGFVGDDTGDNISNHNKYLCELTATYWIWKNVQEDIVGLCHYRRYFNFANDHTKINKIKPDFIQWSGNIKEKVARLFEQYDVVLPCKKGMRKHGDTLYHMYESEHVGSDMDIALEIIKEKYPEQYETAYQVLHTCMSGYYANMLITKKALFDDYAKWLFDIEFELERRIQKDVEKRDTYQQRACAFLAERLITVYIALHPELKIKEVPMVFVEKNKKLWHKYLFRYWRRKILKKLGFRKENK